MTAGLRSSPCHASPHQLHTGAICVTQPEREDSVALRPLELIQDVQNAVQEYCAQGLDAMERCAVESLALEPSELTAFVRGTADLYKLLQARVTEQLQTFKKYATETCLHIPAGLMPAQVTLPQASVHYTEDMEQQLDTELASLRERILMTQRAQQQVKQDIAQLDQELVSCGCAAQLAAVASASGPEKENLAEGASAMVTAALRLQPLLARAQKLRTRDQAMSITNAKNINAGTLAEDKILKQESLVNSLPMVRLQVLTQVLQGRPNME